MKYIKLLLFITFCSTMHGLLHAQEFKKNATSGFVFLEIPVTARGSAMGEASVAIHDFSSDGMFINPAITGFNPRQHAFSTNYASWFADIGHFAASYAYNAPFGVVGIGINYFDFGTMPRTIRVPGQRVYEITGDFSANASALYFCYSKMLTDRFSFGVNLKYVNESIDVYSANNLILDGGVLYFTGLGSLRIAAAMQNFGVDAKYRNDNFKMPTVMKLGAAAELYGDNSSEYRVTVALEAIHPNDGDERFTTGLDVGYKNLLSLWAGYKFLYDEETYSVGIGITPPVPLPLSVGFSLADYGRLGTVTRFSLQLGMN